MESSDGRSNVFRARRMDLFLRLVSSLPPPVNVLDVGGTTEFWRGYMDADLNVTILNIFEQRPLHGLRAVVGDGCDLSQFKDKSFDVVLAHSVLGHVGGWRRQQQMASEVRRVAKNYFIQTPNQRFPIDWRTLVPFFHWAPVAVQAWFLRTVRVGRYTRVRDPREAYHLATRVRNLTRRELRQLFPEGTIIAEAICGIPKSFIVYHGFGRPRGTFEQVH